MNHSRSGSNKHDPSDGNVPRIRGYDFFSLFFSLLSLSLSRHELIELVYFADVGREFLAFRDNSL